MIHLQCHARDQSCCLSGAVFKKLRDQTISKCLYDLFLGVERTRRISLAGFSDLQCCLHNIPQINSPYNCTVFTQVCCICPIKCITVLYDSCSTVMQLISAVWRIQYTAPL